MPLCYDSGETWKVLVSPLASMSLSFDLVSISWVLGLIAQAAIIWRISQAGLGKTFTWFRNYMLVSLLCSLLQMFILYVVGHPTIYAWVYVGWAYLATVFQFFVIRELTAVALQPFPAIQVASRRTLLVFWVVLILVGFAWYYYLSLQAVESSPILRAAIRYQASASIGFALFIFLFLSFLAWMPVPLSRNHLNHCFLVGALFLLSALAKFLTEFGSYNQTRVFAGQIGLIGAFVIYSLWAIRIRPGPDDTLNTPRGRINREEAEVMLARLDQLNRALEKSEPGAVRHANRVN